MTTVQDLFAQLLVERIVTTVAERKPGHCIRVDDAPADLAQQCCEVLAAKLSPPDLAVVARIEPRPRTR